MAQTEPNERKWVLLLCLLAAIHVFIFSAAFPFFNNVDEKAHFDLVVNYSHGEIPRRLELVSAESAQYIVTFSTPEYLGEFHGAPVPPPPWTQPAEQVRRTLFAEESSLKRERNYESAQPPLYYVLAAAWWRLGGWLGIEGAHRLYWLRFLNIFLVMALVWLGYRVARFIFPEQPFYWLGVPAVIAVMPQSSFYSVQNDILSPLGFGFLYLLLLQFAVAKIPGVRLGVWMGISFAAVYLIKLTNLPFLAVGLAVFGIKIWRMLKGKTLWPALPAVMSFLVCAAVPVCGWLIWMKFAFGSFTGSEEKTALLGWTHKPFPEWWHHPIFSAGGFIVFIENIIATFWRGEFLWHGRILASPVTDAIYVVCTLSFIILAVTRFCRSRPDALQSTALAVGAALLLSAVMFLGLLSIQFDFHNCPAPSRDFPYFCAGRFILGGLIPFLILGLYGFDYLLRDLKNEWGAPLALLGIILFLAIGEISWSLPVFFSQYNWFHM